MNLAMKLLTGCLCFLPFALPAEIGIEWSSSPGGTDRQSDGLTPMDGEFEFLLGTFVGITPSRDNLSDWGEAFEVFGTVGYSENEGAFLGFERLANNNPPFTTSARAYLWGRNGSGPGSEWILFGKPGWTWPEVNPFGPPPLPVRWLVSSVSPEDVILGAVNEGGVQMQSERVFFILSYADWAETAFEEGEDETPDGDPDDDGRRNFLEYALGSDPGRGDPPFSPFVSPQGDLVIERAPGREVAWFLQQSDDLQEFTESTEGFEVVDEEPARLVFRPTGALKARRFFRVETRPAG